MLLTDDFPARILPVVTNVLRKEASFRRRVYQGKIDVLRNVHVLINIAGLEFDFKYLLRGVVADRF